MQPSQLVKGRVFDNTRVNLNTEIRIIELSLFIFLSSSQSSKRLADSKTEEFLCYVQRKI